MIDLLMRGALRRALLQLVFAGALLACMFSDQAWAVKVDPLWAAERAAQEARASHPFATMTRDMHPLALNSSERSLPVPKRRPVLGKGRQIRGIKITPTSASWKVKGLKPKLVKLLVQVQLHYGRPLHIISGCRSKKHNRRVGGARRSQHLYCKAADFQIPGVSKHKLAAYLKRLPGRGGVGLYCRSSYVHLDIGPRRQWYWSCGKRKKYKKRRARRKVAKLNNNYSKRRALRKRTKTRKHQRIRKAKRDQ